MPWKQVSVMSSRLEFVRLAIAGGVPLAALCRRFGISRKAGAKWVGRYRADSTDGSLLDRSRRPANSPTRSSVVLEAKVVALRQKHPAWGGRKIVRRLEDLGESDVCSAGTVTAILRRAGLIDPIASEVRRKPVRFEHPEPNDLWQMDFKGHFALEGGGRCHPLTVLDDHSRYALVLAGCGDEKARTVRGHLIAAFERYGLPRRILCDNGSPWGGSVTGGPGVWTALALWLLRQGIGVAHGRPRHPQTQGKGERFHATLVAEVLRWHRFDDLAHARQALEAWRELYNNERPHEAIGMNTPAGRYKPSPRAYRPDPPPIEYGPQDQVRRVSANSGIGFGGKRYGIGKAFRGQLVALRPATTGGVWDVYYCHQRVGQIDEREGGPMRRPTPPKAEATATPLS